MALSRFNAQVGMLFRMLTASSLTTSCSPFFATIGIAITLFAWAIAQEASGLDRQPLDTLPVIKELPDPFKLADGSRVQSPSEWDKHRQLLIDQILTYEYGPLPPEVNNLKAIVVSTKATTRPAEMPGASESDVVLTMGPEDKITLHLHLFIPAAPAGQDPGSVKFPVILRGDAGAPPWGPVKAPIAAAVIQRGYILAEFDRTELRTDKKDAHTGSVYSAWPEYAGSAMSAWAWGYMRCVDYLLTRSDIDAKHIAITGHSRGGKATLLAGALDTRIGLTAPNGSGCGGGGCYRVQAPKSEAIENILKNFPYWFEPHFSEFIGHVAQLPIDQHTVKALVAPRALLETNGLGDLWANPEGSQQTYLAAREVFQYLHASDQIGIAWREGKHEQNLQDWNALLDFADWRFFGKKPERSFSTLAFPASEKHFGWTKP
jgi:hypothetical protein